jgi:hypothetical protein
MQKEPTMSLRLADATLDLLAHEVVPLHDAEGLAVTCLAGAVWITQADDPDDIVLEAGEEFVLDRPGLALVSAPGGPATILVRPIDREARRTRPSLPAHELRPAA